MKKLIAVLLVAMLVVPAVFVSAFAEAETPIEIKVLILPKFENGEMSGDFPGEAQYYYEAYCAGGEEYDIVGGFQGALCHWHGQGEHRHEPEFHPVG